MQTAAIIISAAALILAAVSMFILIKILGSIKAEKSNDIKPVAMRISDTTDALKERTAVIESSVTSLSDKLDGSSSRLRDELRTSVESLGKTLSDTEKQSAEGMARQLTTLSTTLADTEKQSAENTARQLASFEARLQGFEKTNAAALAELRHAVVTQLKELKDDNSKQLDKIRSTVDEKLQSTLEEKMNRSFKAVSERLEAVYKGLGEMQTLAAGVGDLKKVLSNVKNRGILGEIQLEAILSDILTPEQYDTNVATVPDSPNRVEFAIKLPGADGTVYLPIDSKFPGDTYAALQDAYDSGIRPAIDEATNALAIRIKGCAKDIHEKYVMPPYTTSFAVMFLPFEGLYAQVVNMGLVEELQRKYQVNIAGPSTMAAMLNSLYMGFKTLAIQKRSDEVWKILSEVRTEFDKFAEALAGTQKHIRQVDADLEKLIGTRTRAITRRLRSVESSAGDAVEQSDTELLIKDVEELL